MLEGKGGSTVILLPVLPPLLLYQTEMKQVITGDNRVAGIVLSLIFCIILALHP